jgi:hypothetical protein
MEKVIFVFKTFGMGGSGGCIGKNIFDGLSDFSRGDVLCTGACCLASVSE